VIWTDCDREGEAIGYDIIDVCKRHNRNIEVYRAHFSAMTFQDISGAMQRLTPPNRNLSEAVKVR
jgi:DNA topoisomerase-3